MHVYILPYVNEEVHTSAEYCKHYHSIIQQKKDHEVHFSSFEQFNH